MLNVIDHKPGNLTLRVSGDSDILEIQSYLKQHDQLLPLGPFWKGVTISAAIDNNLFGLYSNRYGLLKNLLLNLKLETGRGIIETGADVMKNVSGYDLTRLIIGAKSTLGKIQEATLRIYPIPHDLQISYKPLPAPAIEGTRLLLPLNKASVISDILKKNEIVHQHYSELGVLDLDITLAELGADIKTAVQKIGGSLGVLKNGVFCNSDISHIELQKQIKAVFDPLGNYPKFNG